MRYGYRSADAGDLDEMYTHTRHDGFGPEVKRRIMLGTYALSGGYYDAYYGQCAARWRTKKIAEDFAAVFAQFDLIVTPTAPRASPFEAGREDRFAARDVLQRFLHGN